MSVIERAEQRLAEEERQHELGADNRYDLHYWAAYLDGARAQKKEGGELAMSALNYVERQGFMTGMGYAGMTAEERETLLKEFRNLHVGPVAPLVAVHDYAKLVEALRLCQFGECGCGKCYYKELKGDWCTEDNHPEFFDCDDKLKLDAAAAIEALQAQLPKRGEFVYVRGDDVTCCDGWKCSVCGKTYHTNVPYFGEYKFCPNCGAKMEVQDGK